MKCVSLVLQNSIKQVAARKTQWDCTKLLHSTPKVSIGHAHYHLDIGSIASVRVCNDTRKVEVAKRTRMQTHIQMQKR